MAESEEKIVESQDHLYLSQAVNALPHEEGEEDDKDEVVLAQTPRQRRMVMQDDSLSHSYGNVAEEEQPPNLTIGTSRSVEEKGRERLRGIQSAKVRLTGDNVNTTKVINKVKQKLEEKCLL